VSPPLSAGFGDATLSAVLRPGTGALLCRAGATASLEDAVVEWVEADGSWQARAGDAVDVVLAPLGEPAEFADGSREWLCRVSGRVDGAPLECLGQLLVGGGSPPPDWRKTALVRDVCAWFDADLGFAVHARRPAKADAHDAETLEAIVLRGSPPEAVRVDDPRLSTAYGAGGQMRRAGLELWETEESDVALRLAAETTGEGELRLPGGAILRSAFLLWRHAGRVGAGRYDISLPPPR
jgi:hypothetical protein